ncbi:MAG TPA: PAS domain S-box protein, partial [Candidatus Binatia bacterium]|nr:PAS domain S-box protein [Candidatus Binatia bacterium]
MGSDRPIGQGAAIGEQAEQKLSESEEEFRLMFELSSVGQCQIDPLTGLFIRVNRKISELTGYPEEELTERTIGELTHSDDRERLGATLQQLLCDDSRELSEFSTDARLLRKDGSTIWAHLDMTLLTGCFAQVPRVLVTARDITMRKETQQKLYEAEERMRLATQAADVFAWDVDLLTGTIKYSENMARMFGYEILPEKYFSVSAATELIHPEDREAVIQASRPAFEETGNFSAECRAETAAGGYIWVQCNG